MAFVNRYINWKKNIKFEEVFELNVLFDIKFSDLLIDKINEWTRLMPDQILLNSIRENGFEFNESEGQNFKDQLQSFKSYEASVDKLIGGTIFSPSLKYGVSIDESRSYKACYINLISKNYPDDLIYEVIRESPTLINLIIISNPINFSWEIQTSIGAYKFKKGINIIVDPNSRRKKVDISKRKGRVGRIGNCYFKGASEYYFGPNIFNKIPYEKILAFDDAEKIVKLNHNIIYVKLFDEQDYWEDFAQKRLVNFRSHLEIDRLEVEYLDKIKKL